MKILALDTSAVAASVAITEDSKLTGVYTINYKLTHSQTIMPMIDQLAKMVELDMKTIDYIACSMGPGSFTGIRIGGATAKGLALGLNKPIVPVSTLEALAFNIYNTDKLICPIMDARRQQVYTAIYKWENGSLKNLMPSDALNIDELFEKLLEYKKEVIFVGDGVPVFKDKIKQYNLFYMAPANCNIQNAASVAALAEILIEKGEFVNGEKFAPVYLRKSQAEREREEKISAEA